MNALKTVLVSELHEHSSALFLRITSYITICVYYGTKIHSVPFTASLSTAAVMGCPDRYRQALYAQLLLCTDRPPQTLVESDSTICCMYTIVSS